ncbi:DUF5723 family protein [Spongiivirga sp. MCCC 1A20706]|uniref:DUF5723 family protein n=1 Tax=Spongiivirga sp. MCCC 1A20706 TaxID=3160963 RepID=UPI003977564A
MRKIITALLLLSFWFAGAQNKNLLFGFREIPQSLMVNPGEEVDYKWYTGIPLLSGISVDGGITGGVSVYDVFAVDGVDINIKIRNAIAKLDRTDFTSINQQLEIFNVGFKVGGQYRDDVRYSFGMYQEFDFFGYWPNDYVKLAFEGNATNINVPFSLGDLNLKADLLTVFHVGVNKRVNNKLTVGGRFKIYSNIASASSTNNEGTFITRESDNNFFEHRINADLLVQTSGIASLRSDSDANPPVEGADIVPTFRKRALLGGNLGIGVDAGFTYRFDEQLSFAASIQDLGFIRHSKDVESYQLQGSFVYDGFELLFPGAPTVNQPNVDYYEDVAQALEEALPIDTITKAYTRWRAPKFNAALRYEWGVARTGEDCDCRQTAKTTYLNQVGGQAFMIGRSRGPKVAASLFYYRRLFNGLRVKLAYTADPFSATNLGAGMSAHLGPVNLYLMADNLLGYANLADAQKVSVQFGLNLVVPTNKK